MLLSKARIATRWNMPTRALVGLGLSAQDDQLATAVAVGNEANHWSVVLPPQLECRAKVWRLEITQYVVQAHLQDH